MAKRIPQRPDPRKPKARPKLPPPDRQVPKPNRSNDPICNCPMVAAVRSVKRGQYRLARRYTAMSVRLIAARMVA